MKNRRPHLIVSCVFLVLGFAALASAEIRFENEQRSTVGYLDGSGRIEDASRSTKGYITRNKVEDGGRATIGYTTDYDPSMVEEVACFWFFFFTP